MKSIKISALTLSLSAAMVLAGCGSDVPTIDQVNENFESPSGSTADQSSVISANEKQQASGPALRVAGNGNIFGAGLTAVGKPIGIERLQTGRMFQSELKRLKGFVDGRGQFALNSNQFGLDPISSGESDPCVDNDAVEGALQKLFVKALSGGGGSASFSYDVDVDKCSRGTVTGQMKVDGKIELSQTKFSFQIDQTLTNVCEKEGQQACVTGNFVVDISASGSGDAVSEARFTTAWFADATWVENGNQLSAQIKGGLRANLDASGAAQLEQLVYVKTATGEEVTYVLRITANADGSGTFECRGKDGSITCTVAADGSGSCSAMGEGGSATLNWSAADAEAIAADEELMFY